MIWPKYSKHSGLAHWPEIDQMPVACGLWPTLPRSQVEQGLNHCFYYVYVFNANPSGGKPTKDGRVVSGDTRRLLCYTFYHFGSNTLLLYSLWLFPLH